MTHGRDITIGIIEDGGCRHLKFDRIGSSTNRSADPQIPPGTKHEVDRMTG